MKPSIPWHLLWQFTRRDIEMRFRGSMLGLAWLLLTPLLMLSLFTLVFHGIFGMKWPGVAQQSAIEFGLVLFAGLSVYQFFAEVINRAPLLIVNQPNLVNKVVFPLWILPTATTLSAAVSLGVNVLLLLIASAALTGMSVSWLWLPLLCLPVLLGVLGGAYLFAALGVYWRDLPHLLGMAVTALMFLSPIFYPLAAVPAQWQEWFMLNPLTMAIEPIRAALFQAQAPSLSSLLLLYAVGIGCLLLGSWVFSRLKQGFADVV